MNILASGLHSVRDRSHGRFDSSGALLFEQVVEEEGKPARRRSWRLVRTGNRITGTLSDAAGPVTGEIRGNVIHFKYRAREGNLAVDQRITLHPGGRTASSRIVVRKMVFGKLGVQVGTMRATIRKLD